jgi:hypothetical protein
MLIFKIDHASKESLEAEAEAAAVSPQPCADLHESRSNPLLMELAQKELEIIEEQNELDNQVSVGQILGLMLWSRFSMYGFRPFSVKKCGFLSKTNDMIKVLHNLPLF